MPPPPLVAFSPCRARRHGAPHRVGFSQEEFAAISALRAAAARRLRSETRLRAQCGRRVSFPAMGKKPKDRRGTAQDGRFRAHIRPSLSPLAFGHLPLTRGVGPRSPITGVLSCLWRSPSGAQNQECLGTLSSGPPGPECAKFTSGAVQFLRLGFPTNAPGANPASPQTFPLGGGVWPKARRMRGPFPSSLPPLRGKVPPKGADEGALLDAVRCPL